MISQKKKMIICLKKRKVMTIRDIFIMCNCNSPTKLISDLRRDGYQIEDRWREKDGRRWKEYYLREEKTA